MWSAILRCSAASVAPHLRSELASTADQLPPLPSAPVVCSHGDLHDKNIITAPRHIGIIDLDSTARRPAEDDLANLGVHLELRALQAGHPPIVGQRRSAHLVESYAVHRPIHKARFAAMRRHVWFRLACVYTFRRSSRRHVPVLLQRVDRPTWSAMQPCCDGPLSASSPFAASRLRREPHLPTLRVEGQGLTPRAASAGSLPANAA